MGDMGDDFRAWREHGKQKRENNRENSPEILEQEGVSFERKNGGAHLIVKGKDCLIDFWPGTGKFIARNGKKGRGVFNVLKLCV